MVMITQKKKRALMASLVPIFLAATAPSPSSAAPATSAPSTRRSHIIKVMMDKACSYPDNTEPCTDLCEEAGAECCFANPAGFETCSMLEVDVDCVAYEACRAVYDVKSMVDAACLDRDPDDLAECLNICEAQGAACCISKEQISGCLFANQDNDFCEELNACSVVFGTSLVDPTPSTATVTSNTGTVPASTTSSPTLHTMPTPALTSTSAPVPAPEPVPIPTSAAPTVLMPVPTPISTSTSETAPAPTKSPTTTPTTSPTARPITPLPTPIPTLPAPTTSSPSPMTTRAPTFSALNPLPTGQYPATTAPSCSDRAACEKCIGAEECAWGHGTCSASCPEGNSCLSLDLMAYAQVTKKQVKQDMLGLICKTFEASEEKVQPTMQCADHASCVECLGTGNCGWAYGTCVASCGPEDTCVTLDLLSFGQVTNDAIRGKMLSTFCSQFPSYDDDVGSGASDEKPQIPEFVGISIDGSPNGEGSANDQLPIQCTDQPSCNDCLTGGECVWDIDKADSCVAWCPQGDSCVSLSLLTGGRTTAEEVKQKMLDTFCAGVTGGSEENPQYADSTGVSVQTYQDGDSSGNDQPSIQCTDQLSCSDCLLAGEDCFWDAGSANGCLASCPQGSSCGSLSLLTGGRVVTEDVRVGMINKFCAQIPDSDVGIVGANEEEPQIQCTDQLSCDDCLGEGGECVWDTHGNKGCLTSCPEGDYCISLSLLTGGRVSADEIKEGMVKKYCSKYNGNELSIESDFGNENDWVYENENDLVNGGYERPPSDDFIGEYQGLDDDGKGGNDQLPVQCTDQSSCKACLGAEECGWDSGTCVASCPKGTSCITWSLLTGDLITADEVKEDILQTFCLQYDDIDFTSGQQPNEAMSGSSAEALNGGGVDASDQPINQCTKYSFCRECLGTGACGWGVDTCVEACSPGGPCVTLDLLAYGRVNDVQVRDTMMQTFCTQFDDIDSGSGGDERPTSQGDSPEDSSNSETVGSGNPQVECPEQTSCKGCLASGQCGWARDIENCVASCPPDGDSCVTLDLLAYVTEKEIRDNLLTTFCEEMGLNDIGPASDDESNDARPPFTPERGNNGFGNLPVAQPPIETSSRAPTVSVSTSWLLAFMQVLCLCIGNIVA